MLDNDGVRYTIFMKEQRCHMKGFTLVELLVAITIFTIFITTLVSVFTSFIQFQGVSQNERQAIDTLAGTIDTISREARLGHDYQCGREINSQCRCFVFRDQLGREVEYRWHKERLEKKVNRIEDAVYGCGFDDDGSVTSTDGWVPVTDKSIALKEDGVLFKIDSGTTTQPRVRMRFKGTYVVEGGDRSITLSTQVTQRVLDLGSTQEKLEKLTLRVNTVSSAAKIAYVYGIDGKCYDELGAEQGGAEQGEQTLCDFEKEVKDVVYVASGRYSGLYILTTDGLVFFLNSNQLDFTNTISNTRIAVTTRVAGIDSGGPEGVCRYVPGKWPCSNDPQRIKNIYPAFNGSSRSNISHYVVYALSDDGKLYGIRENKSKRLLRNSDLGRINKIVTGEEFSTTAKDRVVLYKNKIALINNNIGTNNIDNNNIVDRNGNEDIGMKLPGTFLGISPMRFGILEYKVDSSSRGIKCFYFNIGSRTITVSEYNNFTPRSIKIKDLAYIHTLKDYSSHLYLLSENFIYKRDTALSCRNNVSGENLWMEVAENAEGIQMLFPTSVSASITEKNDFVYAINVSGNLAKIDGSEGSANPVTVFKEGNNRFLGQDGKITFTNATSFIKGKQFLVGTYRDDSGKSQRSLFAHKNDNPEQLLCSTGANSQDTAECNKEIRRFTGRCAGGTCSTISIYKFNLKIVEAKP